MIAQHGPLSIVWTKEWDGTWYSLNHMDPNRVHGSGIYIIWQGNDGQAIYVGQGLVADRIRGHQGSFATALFSPLRVSWATTFTMEVGDTRAGYVWDGIERYLADVTKPLHGAAWPDVPPIPVNIPDPIRRPSSFADLLLNR